MVYTVKHRFLEFSGEIRCVPMLKNLIKEACLFRGLSVQLLNVLIAGLECRLLTAFSVCLGSMTARSTCESNAIIKFCSSLSRFALFLLN